LSPAILSTLTAVPTTRWPPAAVATRKGTSMGDQLDVPLEDAVLLEEVELISTLMVAASEAEGPMEQSEIDRLLGVPGRQVPEQPTGKAS
jgi:hypothetical protein